MELTALALLLAASPALPTTSFFTTLDGGYVSQEDGETALRTGQALLIGGLLVGTAAH